MLSGIHCLWIIRLHCVICGDSLSDILIWKFCHIQDMYMASLLNVFFDDSSPKWILWWHIKLLICVSVFWHLLRRKWLGTFCTGEWLLSRVNSFLYLISYLDCTVITIDGIFYCIQVGSCIQWDYNSDFLGVIRFIIFVFTGTKTATFLG